MAWIHDSTKQLEIAIGEVDDNTKWILIAGAVIIIAYVLMRQGGKK